MSPSPSPRSRSPQRITRGSFVVTAIGLYFLSFASQILLAAPVTRHASVFAFAAAQIVLIAVWLALHRRRLRDAGRPLGIATGVAIVYALEVLFLIIVVGLMLSSSATDGAGPNASILQLFVIIYLLTMLTGDPSLGPLQLWIFGFVVLMALPIVIALGFSIWTAILPSAAGESDASGGGAATPVS
jgi:uncharacterized membrane protein YhaH (DUF805 family)